MSTINLNFFGRPSRSPTAKALITVTGSQRPYIYDLPHLLSLPSGFEFRFRYRHRWVDKTMVDVVSKDNRAYAGRQVVILFHSQDSKRVIPVRLATVLGIEAIGPMIFVRFRAGVFFKADIDIASYSYDRLNDSDSAASALFVKAKHVLGHIDGEDTFDFSKALPAGSYLRESSGNFNDSDLDRGDPVAAWARMVAVLHREPSLNGIPFFYLVGFRTEEGSVVPTESVQNRFSATRAAIGGFRLRESRRYRMRIAEWCESPKSVEQRSVSINCEFNRTHLALEGSSNLVVGRYDVIEFTFSCLQPGYSEVALRAEPLREAGNAVAKVQTDWEGRLAASSAAPWDTWPAVFVARVPVVVYAKPSRILLPAFALTVGMASYLGLAPILGEKFGDKWRGFAELAGLAVLYFGYGAIVDRLERLFKLSGGLRRLGGGSRAWETQDKS